MPGVSFLIGKHYDTIFLVAASQVCSEFDTKEEMARGGFIMRFAVFAVGLRTMQRESLRLVWKIKAEEVRKCRTYLLRSRSTSLSSARSESSR